MGGRVDFAAEKRTGDVMDLIQIPSNNGPKGELFATEIIIHSMAEWIDRPDRDYSAWEWLEKSGLSTHFFVTPLGLVLQQRQLNQRSYHARGHNLQSIGIEVLVPGLHTYESFLVTIQKPWVLRGQFTRTIQLVRWILKQPGIKRGVELRRHQDVSSQKRDPGDGFEWGRFCRAVEDPAHEPLMKNILDTRTKVP